MSVLAIYILTITIGAISIGKMLILNQTLEVLEMGYNEIGDDEQDRSVTVILLIWMLKVVASVILE